MTVYPNKITDSNVLDLMVATGRRTREVRLGIEHTRKHKRVTGLALTWR
jgi:hypothetical protein